MPRFLALLLAVTPAVLPATVPPATDKPTAPSAWLTNVAVARALARQTGRPLFVVFR